MNLADLTGMAPTPSFRRGNPGVWGTAGKPTPPRKTKAAPTKRPGGILSNLPELLSGATANEQAMAILGPIFEAQNKRINSAYDGRTNATRDAYAQLAEIGKGVGPAVQGAYDNAAKNTAAFGKGFSDAIAQLGGGYADQATQGLAAQGGPQTVSSGLTSGGGDALYAMGGAIPASQLAREGAAFTSAASFLPSTAAGLGIEALRGLDQERLQDLMELESERPGTVLEMVNGLTDRSYNQRQDAIKLRLDNRDFNYRAKQDRLSYADKAKTAAQSRRDMQVEAALVKLDAGVPLTKRDRHLINTYGMTPTAAAAAYERADDARAAKAAAADDARSMRLQKAKDTASAARAAASDARKAMLATQKAAAASGLEKDKQEARMALEHYKAAQRRKLQTQKDLAITKRGRGKKKGSVADDVFGD